MSRYTIEECRRRAEAAEAACASGEQERIIREHCEAAVVLTGDAARIAAGYATIARRRLEADSWRADAYRRLQDGEDITDSGPTEEMATSAFLGIMPPRVHQCTAESNSATVNERTHEK